MNESAPRTAEPRPLTRRELRAMQADVPAGYGASAENDAPAGYDIPAGYGAPAEHDLPAAYVPPVWNLDDAADADYAPPVWDLADEAPTSRPLTRRELRERRAVDEPASGAGVGVPGPVPAPAVESATREPAPWAGVSQVLPPPSESFTVPRLAAGFRTSRVSEIPVAAVRAAEMVAPGVGAAGLSGIASGWSPVLDAPADERAASAQQADERAAPAQHTDAFAAPAQHTDAEVPTTTDGFGMPAVLMDAPVLPALRPIEEIEAELSDPPESAVPTPRVARPLPRLATELPPAPHALGARRAAPLTQAPAADAVPSASDAAPASQAAGAASQVWTPSPGPGVGPSAARSPVAPQAKRHAPNPIVPESLRRPPSPWQAVYGAWIGIVSVIVWPLGVVALALGAWSLVLAVREGYGRPRPVIAIVGGVIGISLGVGFLLFGPS